MPSKRVSDLFKDYTKHARFELCLKAALAMIMMKGNPLPELVDIFGYEKAMQFILVFGGTQFRVPDSLEIVRPLNVAGAAMAVFQHQLTVEKAAKKFKVPLLDVLECLKFLQDENAAVNKRRKIMAEVVEEIRDQLTNERV